MSLVASVLMGTKGSEDWGASGADLYIYNRWVSSHLRCTPRYTIYIAWPNSGQSCDSSVEDVGWAYAVQK
jgi:hypothetical protein